MYFPFHYRAANRRGGAETHDFENVSSDGKLCGECIRGFKWAKLLTYRGIEPDPFLVHTGNAVQCLARTLLKDVGEASCRRKYFEADEAVENVDSSFEDNYFRTWIWLRSDRVYLPADGLATSVDIIKLFPYEITAMYAQ